MYAGNNALIENGALSIAVPGELAGLHKAWEQLGRLSWERLVRPSVHLARRGFKISPYLHMQMVKAESGIMADKGFRDIFTSNGKLLQPGDICRNKKLAQTLRTISKYGMQAFYNGSVGTNIIRDVQKVGGILTMKDLQSYQVKLREPIFADILGLKILGMPPPSTGSASLILILNILAQYGVPLGVTGALGSHRQIESVKHALALRMNLGFYHIRRQSLLHDRGHLLLPIETCFQFFGNLWIGYVIGMPFNFLYLIILYMCGNGCGVLV